MRAISSAVSEHPELASGGSGKSLKLLFKRAISSAGSEHLVYTEGVGGSNPSSPTRIKKTGAFASVFFIPIYFIPCIKRNKFNFGFALIKNQKH